MHSSSSKYAFPVDQSFGSFEAVNYSFNTFGNPLMQYLPIVSAFRFDGKYLLGLKKRLGLSQIRLRYLDWLDLIPDRLSKYDKSDADLLRENTDFVCSNPRRIEDNYCLPYHIEVE
ncbi:hypothetical protein Tco_0749534 [Tanacetum coccineum]|uniref:Uncharacterized protein n=1 Tax=Tanacetum coccineum TaxID=301880 RepID=A0ABQ4YYP4_9ASTR